MSLAMSVSSTAPFLMIRVQYDMLFNLVHVGMDLRGRAVEHPVGDGRGEQRARRDLVEFRPQFLVEGHVLGVLSLQLLPVHVHAVELVLLHQGDDVLDEGGPDRSASAVELTKLLPVPAPPTHKSTLTMVAVRFRDGGLDAAVVPTHRQLASPAGAGRCREDAQMRVGFPCDVFRRDPGPPGPIRRAPADFRLFLLREGF